MQESGSVSRAWWSVVVLFLVHGLVVSTWVARIPAVQSELKLSNGVLGLTLLTSALGALIAIPYTGHLVNRFGSKSVSTWATFAFCAALVPMSLAVNAWTLGAALIVYGATAAAMDVAMNAQGVEVEKRLGKPTMSRFHAMFSLGGMTGAALGGFIARQGVIPIQHFLGATLLTLVFAALVVRLMIETHAGPRIEEHSLPYNKIPPVLLAMSAIAFCILLSEGAMADWIGIYLKQDLGAGPDKAAWGYAVFSGAMATFRMLGDLITAKLGALMTVRLGSLLGAAGLVWSIAMQSPGLALPGFALTGAGFSVIIPLVFGSGGRVPGVSPGAGIATVTGLGYIGFLVGPPLIGFVSQLVTVRYALLVVVACCLISAVLSSSVGRLNMKIETVPQPAVEAS